MRPSGIGREHTASLCRGAPGGPFRCTCPKLNRAGKDRSIVRSVRKRAPDPGYSAPVTREEQFHRRGSRACNRPLTRRNERGAHRFTSSAVIRRYFSCRSRQRAALCSQPPCSPVPRALRSRLRRPRWPHPVHRGQGGRGDRRLGRQRLADLQGPAVTLNDSPGLLWTNCQHRLARPEPRHILGHLRERSCDRGPPFSQYPQQRRLEGKSAECSLARDHRTARRLRGCIGLSAAGR
jgi:hypothetical protein